MNDRRSLVRFVTYAAVGAVGTLAQYAFLIAVVSRNLLTPVVGSMVGAVIGAIVNYLLNARFTFRGASHRTAIPKFASTALLGIGCSGLSMKVLVDHLHVNYLVSQVVATVLTLFLTYFVNLIWTFRHATPSR